MHRIDIPASVTDGITARRGTLHPFGTLSGANTALLVVDLQNAFMLPGQPSEIPVARAIVPNVNRLAKATRAAGGKVVWIKMTLNDQTDKWSVFFDHFMSPTRRGAVIEALARGSHGQALHADLDVQPGDLQVEKTRFSAFIQGSSDLDRILKSLGIDSIIVVGTLSNVCCESTVRDAMMLNYKAVMVSDANAARTDAEHNATLISMLQVFADVVTTDEVIARLVPGTQKTAAAGE
jgi:ureidoacrylate peracid hydrolase